MIYWKRETLNSSELHNLKESVEFAIQNVHNQNFFSTTKKLCPTNRAKCVVAKFHFLNGILCFSTSNVVELDIEFAADLGWLIKAGSSTICYFQILNFK